MANLRKQQMLEKRSRFLPAMLHEPKVAIYARVSSDKQAKEATIDRQLSLAQELYQTHFPGQTQYLSGIYKDEGYNLEAKAADKEFWRLAELIRAGQINTLILASEDRIFRGESAALRGEITDLLRHHQVKLITSTNTTQYSRSDTTNRLVSSIHQELGAISKLETVKTLQHGRRRKLSEEEAWYLITPPYGLRCQRRLEDHRKHYTYLLIEDEAKYVRDIYRLYVGQAPETLPRPAAGKPLGANRIAALLNQAGADRSAWIRALPAGVGTQGWDRQKVLRILRNETYTGRLTVTFSPTSKVAGFQDVLTSKTIAVPAIIDQGLFDQAQALLRARRNKILDDYAPRVDTNYLHGYIVCPHCSSRLVGRLVAGGHRYYGCPSSTQKASHGLHIASDLESLVEKELMGLLQGELEFSKLLGAISARGKETKDLSKLAEDLAQLDEGIVKNKLRLEKIVLSWADGTLDDTAYKEIAGNIRVALSELEYRKQQIQEKLLYSKSTGARIDSLHQLRGLLDQALEQPEAKTKILRLLVGELVERIDILRLPAVSVAALDLEQIKEHYLEGRLTPKLLRAAGWSTRRIYSLLGLSGGRKAAKEYAVKIIYR